MSIAAPGSAANNSEGSKGSKVTRPPGGSVLKQLFARFYGKPLHDVVPAGINRRANVGGLKPQAPPRMHRRGVLGKMKP